jgi:catechol 2,3-dioxygenase-like lactoylglutathione lyase family enzyme
MRLPAPVAELPVGDLRAAIDAYTGRMGFRLDWTYEEALAGISKDDARIFLRRRTAQEDEAGSSVLVWLNMDSPAAVDRLHAEWTARGVAIVEDLHTTPYDLRQFIARDGDGNRFRVFHDLGTSGVEGRPDSPHVNAVVPQLRTTDLAASIRFYTATLGLVLEFRYEDFYAGIRAGSHVFHLKQVDSADPSVEYVDHGDHFHLYLEVEDANEAATALARKGVRLVKPVADTPWNTREFVIKDDQGHTLYLGQRLAPGQPVE